MKTILCGQFKQETNRYAPGLSDEKAYRDREYFFGESAVRGHFVGGVQRPCRRLLQLRVVDDGAAQGTFLFGIGKLDATMDTVHFLHLPFRLLSTVTQSPNSCRTA